MIEPTKETPRRWVAGTLLLLTAAGAFLRFFRLGHQAYWTDEAYTIGRIKGTFAYMLERLSDQGFPPGWYAMLRGWCDSVEHFTGNGALAFSEGVTRMLPALLGTLTVPAMYLLARAFFGRRGALLAAGLTAVNPFLIYYSRDIKMYAALVCFAVLHAAGFFRWVAASGRGRWGWAALALIAGLLMTAMHSTTWILVGLELLFLLTRPSVTMRAADGPLFVTGAGLMAALPAYWYLGWNHYVERVLDRHADASLLWITRYTDMSWTTVLGLPTEQLLGFLWPIWPVDGRLQDWFSLGPDFERHAATRTWAWLATGEWMAGVCLVALLLGGIVLGLRRAARKAAAGEVESVPPIVGPARLPAWWVGAWVILPTAVLAATWLPPGTWMYRLTFLGHAVQPIWEPRYLMIVSPAMVLWLAAAIAGLPGRWTRGIVAVLVGAVCVVSAGSNYFLYRSAPYQVAAAIAAKYAATRPGTDERSLATVAIGNPGVSFLGEIDAVTYPLALGQRPDPAEQLRSTRDGGVAYRLGAVNNARELSNADITPTLRFLRLASITPGVRAIVLTDRNGDLAGAADPLPDAAAQRILGADWRLAETDRYAWHYEWRFYFFHTWRTRVWVRSTSAAGDV